NTDQYSLAATYYELRVGKSLFHCGNLHQLILDHMERPPNLSALPPAEAEVLTRALAKEPNQRYPNCSAFVAALQGAVLPSSASKTDNDPTKKIFRRGSSVRTHPLESTDPNLQRELRLARRRRMAVVMCILLGLILVAGVAAILLVANNEERENSSRSNI